MTPQQHTSLLPFSAITYAVQAAANAAFNTTANSVAAAGASAASHTAAAATGDAALNPRSYILDAAALENMLLACGGAALG